MEIIVPVLVTSIICVTVFFICKFFITTLSKLGTRAMITYTNTHIPPKPKEDPTLRQEMDALKTQVGNMQLQQGITRPALKSIIPGRG